MKTINVEKRNMNKRSRNLRKSGLIPGVIFGNEMENLPITIPKSHLEKQLAKKAVVYTVKNKDREISVVIQELQKDPVTHEILHVSLLNVPKGVDTTVETPINFIGEAPGVREGGVLQVISDNVQITGVPSKIPGEIMCDVSEMNIGDKITVSDLSTKKRGLEISEEFDKVLAVCLPPTIQEEKEETVSETRKLNAEEAA